MSVKDMVYDHEKRITVMAKALHCLKLEVRDLENWVSEKNKIVRCKECKYCDGHYLVDGLFCYRLYGKYNKEYPQMIIEVDADDFCSRGKRK